MTGRPLDTHAPTPAAAPEPHTAAPGGLPEFVRLTGTTATSAATHVPSMRRVVAQLLAVAAVLVGVVTVGGAYASSQLAEREAVNDAANTANMLAQFVVQPVLDNRIVRSDPASVARLDEVVRRSVLPNHIVRVKLWRPDGTIVYADDPQLIGRTFTLDDEQREVLASPQTRAEVSDLSKAENELERLEGRLLEVYRPIWTPNGDQLMFEVYGDYAPVAARAAELRKGLTGLLVTTVLLLVTLLAPLAYHLVSRLRAGSKQRETLMQRAVDASEEERQRIALHLHDGPVQELVASAYAVAGAAERAGSAGQPDLAHSIRGAEQAVRSTVGTLRSLLVDLYPASLTAAGLNAALTDLSAPLRSRGVDVELRLDERAAAELDPSDGRLVYRTARECLRNVAAHAEATWVSLTLSITGASVVLDVVDDGVGFDVPSVLSSPASGHLGLRSLVDTAAARGAALYVASAPDAGTAWRLTIPPSEGTAT